MSPVKWIISSKYSFEHEHLMETYFFTYSWAHHPSGLFCSSPCCWSSALTLNSVVSNPSSPESLITGPNISDQGDSTSLWSWLSSCASSDCPWSPKAEFISSNLWISTLLLECLCFGNFQYFQIRLQSCQWFHCLFQVRLLPNHRNLLDLWR